MSEVGGHGSGELRGSGKSSFEDSFVALAGSWKDADAVRKHLVLQKEEEAALLLRLEQCRGVMEADKRKFDAFQADMERCYRVAVVKELHELGTEFERRMRQLYSKPDGIVWKTRLAFERERAARLVEEKEIREAKNKESAKKLEEQAAERRKQR